jgi:hypothetical protein
MNHHELDALLQPDRLFSRTEVLARPSPVPRQSGVYAWYFREVPPDVPIDGCHQHNGLVLLYVGISPQRPPTNGAPPSRGHLHKRLRNHYRGNASISTLRLTLGTLLGQSLGISLRRTGRRARRTFGDGESVLSHWMDTNTLVCWQSTPMPWVLEDHLILTGQLPLNLQGNKKHPFHSTLELMRRRARERADQLPIV